MSRQPGPGQPRPTTDPVTAVVGALAAGEAKRALALLGSSGVGQRSRTALTAWAHMMDLNRYPGEVGAETASPLVPPSITLAPGEPVEEFLEQLVEAGPAALFTPRTLIEGWLRQGQPDAVRQVLGSTLGKLEGLQAWASARGRPDLVAWAELAGADLLRRAGMVAEADAALAASRARLEAAHERDALATTWLTEGDWYAAPGSSPEALGWDLAPQEIPSPMPADPARAASCWSHAESLGPSHLAGPLALRHAILDRLRGDPEERRDHLAAALAGYRATGDAAGVRLVAIHQVVADIDEGRLTGHAVDLGGGWHVPRTGPVAELVAWERSVGSRSWAVGLGRLLQRCAGHWADAGSASRARIGHLAALHLLRLAPEIPSRTLVTAVAHAEAGGNLGANAVLRLDRAFGDELTGAGAMPPGADADLAGAEILEARVAMVNALRALLRGPAASLAAARLSAVADALAATNDRRASALGPWHGTLPATPEELLAAMDALGDAPVDGQLGLVEQRMTLMRHFQLGAARATASLARVLALLARGDVAERSGHAAEAERWYGRAAEAAGEPDAEPHLLPLVLVAARRFDEARAALAVAGDRIPDQFQLVLWLRARDPARAAAALRRLEASGRAPTDWSGLLSVAEIRLATGHARDARHAVGRAIDAFADSVRLLLRDPDRLAAWDQPDVTALFTTLALTFLPTDPDAPAGHADAEASLEAAETLRALSGDPAGALASVNDAVRHRWQHAAAEYAATTNRLLARLPPAGSPERETAYASLDAADAELAAAEHAVDAADPGVLLRRTTGDRPPSVVDLRHHLPEGTVLLEYLAIGDDLLGWAVARDGVRVRRQRIHLRDLGELIRAFHVGCSAGAAPVAPGQPGGELARLLLEPFAAVLRGAERVLVVPFGPLTLVAFHALRLDGLPLGLTHVVSYLPRASALLASRGGVGLDAPAARSRPLVIGDPAFDPGVHPALRRLPGARAEADAVSRLLGAPPDAVLVDSAATERAVGERLDACDLLHVSSHGHLDELAPFASSLVLAGRDELTVADIAGLRFATDLAVLTGCDTGRGAATLGGDLVGLTRALLRGGVRRAVVSLWPVDDHVAPVLMHRFYAALSAGSSPADAMAAAQRTVHAMTAEHLHAAYAELGGDPTATSRRRGEELDPELRDEVDLPAALAGDAERYWAPFIVVG